MKNPIFLPFLVFVIMLSLLVSLTIVSFINVEITEDMSPFTIWIINNSEGFATGFMIAFFISLMALFKYGDT